MSGPLTGIRILELRGIGPVPFAGMLLSDLGADVVRIDRLPVPPVPNAPREMHVETLGRGRRSVALDLKQPSGRATLLRMSESADALLEGFRPGVAERLGIGPTECLARNPRLVYGRMTGWGQDGPLAAAAGHDINYIALTGALHGIGRRGEAPAVPLNLIGDFGGGAMFLALGIVSALLEARTSGHGQVVDAAMIDGAGLLTTMFHELMGLGLWREERASNMLDSGAAFYDVYETSDGRHVSIGAIEPQFYAELMTRLELDLPRDATDDGQIRAALTATFRTRTMAQWQELLEGTDVCFAPVLTMSESYQHPHNVARGAYVEVDGTTQPAPAPRFSRTPAGVSRGAASVGKHTGEVLAELGFSADEVADLRAGGVAF